MLSFIWSVIATLVQVYCIAGLGLAAIVIVNDIVYRQGLVRLGKGMVTDIGLIVAMSMIMLPFAVMGYVGERAEKRRRRIRGAVATDR